MLKTNSINCPNNINFEKNVIRQNIDLNKLLSDKTYICLQEVF